ncbi:MAG: hypothetical protein QOE86_3542 [Solirubrobacteraceae bacterium]|nr:hypothetical protein [Solirubrobacteraceae bacterium]
MRLGWLSGLRGRITAALVAVAGLTLVVAAITLLLPLDQSLRKDALRSLSETAATARPSFEDLPRSALRRGSLELRRAARALRRRSGAEVVVIDRAGHVLVATDPARTADYPAVAAALRRRSRITGSAGSDGIRSAIRVDSEGKRLGLVLHESLRSVAAAEGVVRRALILSGALGLLAAFVAGALLAGRLVRRLRGLRDQMADAADLEDAGIPTAAAARDEIGDLDRSFAAMRERIAEQERARRRFVATASHELRTPLASLQLILDSIDQELATETPDLHDARSQIARGRAQGERLVKLASELLDLSRLDAAQALRAEPVELAELARAVATEFPSAPVALDAPVPSWVLADPGGVVRILRILLDNAVRHAGASGPIDVSVHPGGVGVRDRGPGIPDAERDLIFERFRRGSTSATGTGFGLGLAIALELARGMGGNLRLDGAADGAHFVLELPGVPADQLE